MDSKTIQEALQGASFCLEQAGLEQSRVEAEILLSNLMKTDPMHLFLNRDREMPSLLDTMYCKAVKRRVNGEPSAYITGNKYFYGYRFIVNRNVLIPRPETELIVESALQWVGLVGRRINQPINCIDLGTGSGILAITLAKKLPRAAFWAVDLSSAALETAKENAALLNVSDKICFLQGDYYKALLKLKEKPRFNLILSNPPYIRKSELNNLPAEVKDFEPIEALDGGEDGLDGYRSILDGLPQFVRTPALLLLEIGAGRQQEIELLCAKSGLFRSINWCYDLAGHPRVFAGYIR